MSSTFGITDLANREHIAPDTTGDNIAAKKSANYVWDGANWQRMTQPSGGSGLTDTQLRATAVPVSLAAAPTTPVTGTFWQTTQPTSEVTGLVPKVYDYMSYTNTNTTTDTYLYKTGGAGGTTVATVTIVYSDATTKLIVSTVTRT